jgi:hypothetical protein
MCSIWAKYQKNPHAYQKEIRSDQFFGFVKKRKILIDFGGVNSLGGSRYDS